MTKPNDVARLLWENGGLPLQELHGCSLAKVPGKRPKVDRGFEYYCEFVRNFRRPESSRYRKFVPTTSTFRDDHFASCELAIEVLRKMNEAIILREFPVDIHVGVNSSELVEYVKNLTPLDELCDIYVVSNDYKCLVARSHHDRWYVISR